MIPQSLKNAIKCTLVALLVGIFLCPNALSQTIAQKKLEIVILAVTEFEDHRWDNPQLQLGIAKSSADLQKYFADHFPKAEVHLLDSKEQTKFGSIVSFMQDDFPKFANGNVTLFFVLSHGIADNHPNPNFNQDLLIATSETDKSTHTKALSVAKNLVPAFAGLDTPGSIVLLFLDTCYSGAAEGLNLQTMAAAGENYGLRMMIMASSLSEAQSYRATFSEALLDLWSTSFRSSACTDPQQAPSQLRRFIATRLKPQSLKPTEGFPEVIVPFHGRLCLESFAAENGLFVFLNARPEAVAATILSNGKPIDEFWFPLPLQNNKVVPYQAPRDHYTVVIEENDGSQQIETLPVDLTEEPVTFVPIGPANTKQLANGFEKAADYAASAGLPHLESISYQKRALATYALAGDQDRAFDIASQIDAGKSDDGDVKLAQKLAFSSKVAYSPVSRFASRFFGLSALCILLVVLASISFGHNPPLKETYVRSHRVTEVTAALALIISAILYFSFSWSGNSLAALLKLTQGRASAARLEKLAGRFDRAADLYAKAAASPPKGTEPQSLAIQAYFAYGASGQIDKASEFRKKNQVVALERDCPTCVEKEQAALREQGKGMAHEEFSSLCTVEALSNLKF